MSDEIVFYFNPRSRAQMAHWMLEEVGAPYRTVLIDFEKKENKTPQFLSINPMGKLPTITWRGMVVTETAAIIAFLADAFPQAALAPSLDDPRRGPYFRWLFFGAGCIEPALIDHMFKRPDPPVKGALGYGSYDDVVTTLKKALSPGPYLLGSRFTAADVYVGSEIYWAGKIGADRFNDDPVFTDYVARLAERPAWKRSILKDAKAFQPEKAASS
jgi:glutathione S-transferase